MRSPTIHHKRRLTEGMETDDNWVKEGRYDSEFVAAVQKDIEALRDLPPNWDGYGAPVIDPRFIDAAKRFIASLPDNLAFRPLVVPTSNGSLQLEWHEGPRNLELEVESPRTFRFLQWHPEEGIEEEDTIAVEDTERAVDLINWFTRGARR